MKLRDVAVGRFRARFGCDATYVVRAPGRVNLIGEHTDYNGGFVLPMAIDRAVIMALRARDDRHVRVYSVDFAEEREFDLPDGEIAAGSWIGYVHATALSLQAAGYALEGFDAVSVGDVPVGAGLSSSAALELATVRAFSCTSGFEFMPKEMALVAQRAENVWVGVNCGIMDQMISAAGERNHALLIDCRSLQLRSVPMPRGTAVVIMDTATRRELMESAYNERRQSCEAAAAALGVRLLRDADVDMLNAAKDRMTALMFKRARHVITENARTVEAAAALAVGDAQRVGLLMNESHVSLRDDFEVSRAELDAIVELAQLRPECFGARMTGAGFGGCAVALVREDAVTDFVNAVVPAYRAQTGLEPAVYVSCAAPGASAETPDGSSPAGSVADA